MEGREGEGMLPVSLHKLSHRHLLKTRLPDRRLMYFSPKLVLIRSVMALGKGPGAPFVQWKQ